MLYRAKIANEIVVDAIQLLVDEDGYPFFDLSAETPSWYVEHHALGIKPGAVYVQKYNDEPVGHGVLVKEDGEEEHLNPGDYLVLGEDDRLFIIRERSFDYLFEPMAPCKECIYFASKMLYADAEEQEQLKELEADGKFICGCCMAAPYQITTNMEQLHLSVNGRNSCRMRFNERFMFKRKVD